MSLPSALLGFLNKLVKNIAGIFGFIYIGKNKIPKKTLLGMNNANIQSVIDIGANTGQFSRYIRSVLPDAQIYAFEPLPGAYHSLEKWASSIPNRKVEAFHMAIGESKGDIEMNCHVDFTPSSSLLSSTDNCESTYPMTQKQEKIMVPMMTLDEALADTIIDIPKGILVKLDVQGYEDRVIRGGTNILSQATAIILEISLDKLYTGQADFQELVNMLYKLDFKYAGNFEQVYGKDGHVIFIDALFSKNK